MIKKILITVIAILVTSSAIGRTIPITTQSSEALKLYEQAWKLESKLMLDEAEALYKQAVGLDESFALAYMRLGMVKDNYDNRKIQLRKAMKLLDKVSEGERLWITGRAVFYLPELDSSKEYENFKKLVELHPNDSMSNYLFATVNYKHGGDNPLLAVEHFKKAAELDESYSNTHNELAYVYMELKDFEQAKEAAKKYLEVLPGSVNPLDTYAEILMRSGEYEESIKKYKEVLKLDPEFPWALLGISSNMNFLQRHQEGRTYIEMLNENTLNDYEYRHKWRAKVTSYLDEGDVGQAINVLENQKQMSIKGLNKREPSFHIYYAYLRKTRLYFENNKPEKGLIEYQNWLEHLKKTNSSEKTINRITNLLNYYLAYKAFLESKFEETERHLAEYLSETNGETDQTRILMGRVLIKKGKIEQAVNQISETDLTNPYNQYWMMIALLKSNDIEKAKEYRTKILNLNERNDINLSLVRKKALTVEI